MMSSVSAGVLACLLDDTRRRHRFAFPLFAPRRLAPRPAHRVGGRGAGWAACLLCDVMPAVWRWRGHDLDVELLCCLLPYLCRPSRPTCF